MKDLRDFIELLEQRSQLMRVKTPVSAELEITEITDRVSKLPPEQNKALLFENVRWLLRHAGADQCLWIRAAHGLGAGGGRSGRTQ